MLLQASAVLPMCMRGDALPFAEKVGDERPEN